MSKVEPRKRIWNVICPNCKSSNVRLWEREFLDISHEYEISDKGTGRAGEHSEPIESVINERKNKYGYKCLDCGLKSDIKGMTDWLDRIDKV